jgi:holo-[acyl-carrier protein] synthase
LILGIGLDVVATERIARLLANSGSDFEERVFTAAELEECRERADRAQALGARFAAKEACFKALGTGWTRGLSFRQVEVTGLAGGRPELRLAGEAAAQAQALGVRRILVSLTHEADVAAAVVVLEGGAVNPGGG